MACGAFPSAAAVRGRNCPGDGNTTYIGINPGKAWFERRVDSNLYLPPIDLRTVKADEHPSLSMDMYTGFTGLCLAKYRLRPPAAERTAGRICIM